MFEPERPADDPETGVRPLIDCGSDPGPIPADLEASADDPDAATGPARARARARRLAILQRRESRIGVAILLSFLILIGVLVANRRRSDGPPEAIARAAGPRSRPASPRPTNPSPPTSPAPSPTLAIGGHSAEVESVTILVPKRAEVPPDPGETIGVLTPAKVDRIDLTTGQPPTTSELPDPRFLPIADEPAPAFLAAASNAITADQIPAPPGSEPAGSMEPEPAPPIEFGAADPPDPPAGPGTESAFAPGPAFAEATLPDPAIEDPGAPDPGSVPFGVPMTPGPAPDLGPPPTEPQVGSMPVADGGSPVMNDVPIPELPPAGTFAEGAPPTVPGPAAQPLEPRPAAEEDTPPATLPADFGKVTPTPGPTPKPDPTGWVPVPKAGPRSAPEAKAGPPGNLPPAGPAPAGRPPLANEAQATPIDPVRHRVRSGENFWTISQLYYGSGRYYKALWEANRDRVPEIDKLYVDSTVRIPPPEALDRALVDVSGAGESSPASSSTTRRRSVASSRGSSPSSSIELALPVGNPNDVVRTAVTDAEPVPAIPGRPTYVVQQHETLRSIADRTLGDPYREAEILELNRESIRDPRRLDPGLRLVLPDDANLSRVRR